MKVHLSAGRKARQFCPPSLIEGIVTDVDEVWVAPGVSFSFVVEIKEQGRLNFTVRATGETYHEIPMWEIISIDALERY